MAALYLIRHGQASFNSDNYDKLSPLGEKQAHVLGTMLRKRGIQFDAAFAGTMLRHAETAQHCLNGMGLDLEPGIVPGFNEYDHEEVLHRHRPDFSGQGKLSEFLATQSNPHKTFQIEFEKALHRWRGGEFDHEYTESWPQFTERCSNALLQVCEQAGNAKSIAVFSSGGPIAVSTGHCLGLQDSHIAELSWSLMNCSVTSLLFNSKKISLRYFNDFSHFEYSDPSLLSYR